MLGSTTGCWANGCSGFGMLVQAGRRCKAKNSPLCRARQPESWAPSGFLQNQPAASPLAERNARIMQSNCAREEGMERREEAALYTVSSGACTACVSSLEGFFQGKREVIQGPGPWQLCVSNREPSVQALHCFSVFVPCPEPRTCGNSGKAQAGSQGSATAPEPPLDTAKVEKDTSIKDFFPFAWVT